MPLEEHWSWFILTRVLIFPTSHHHTNNKVMVTWPSCAKQALDWLGKWSQWKLDLIGFKVPTLETRNCHQASTKWRISENTAGRWWKPLLILHMQVTPGLLAFYTGVWQQQYFNWNVHNLSKNHDNNNRILGERKILQFECSLRPTFHDNFCKLQTEEKTQASENRLDQVKKDHDANFPVRAGIF